jgi:hypothetical protein
MGLRGTGFMGVGGIYLARGKDLWLVLANTEMKLLLHKIRNIS